MTGVVGVAVPASTMSLAASALTNISLTQNAVTSLLASDPITVTGSGHTVAFFVNASSTDDMATQVSLTVDGVQLLGSASGLSLSTQTVLSSGSHTVAYEAYAFNAGTTMTSAGLIVLDLGM